MSLLKVAAAQMQVKTGQVQKNLEIITSMLFEASSHGAQLLLFPEAALTGYDFASAEEARAHALNENSEAVQKISQSCAQTRIHALVGLVEKSGEKLFNSVYLFGPDGVLGKYQKVHLPVMGVDRFVQKGSGPFALFEIHGVKVGVLICYDLNFPEAARTLALQGAELIVLATGWPQGCSFLADKMLPCRAFENRLYLLAANQVGSAGPFTFIGKSTFCAPNGKILAQATREESMIIYGEVDAREAQNKEMCFLPGTYELNFFAHREPSLYQLQKKV